jgi:pimeloyl-ACP methyl ester carboxylesterase
MAVADPMRAFIDAMRSSLVASGLTRHELDGSVYFAGGATDAPPLVLVHGVNDQAGTWAPVVPSLLERFRLIVPDLAGHGDSEPVAGPISLSVVLDSFTTVLDFETSGKVTLIGNSMGAWVSILYTLANPERVERLFLESGGGLALPLSSPLTASNRKEAEQILRAVHGPHSNLPEWAIDALLARSVDSPLLRIIGSDLVRHFVDERLGEIKVPTVVIWGAHDGLVPREYVERLHSGIAGSRLAVIDTAAHIPHLQQPERFLACLTTT